MGGHAKMRKPRYQPRVSSTASSDGAVKKTYTFWQTQDTNFRPSNRQKSDFTKDGTMRSKFYLGTNDD